MPKTKYVACAAVLLGLGCSSEAEPTGTSIKMVGAFSVTGVSAVGTWAKALSLAADDATEGLAQAQDSRLKPITFESEAIDTKNDPATTVAIAQQAVAENVKMIINGTSGDTVALSKLAYDADETNNLNVPIICVACSSPSLHKADFVNTTDPVAQAANRNSDKWIFGLAMSSVPQSTVLWNILVDKTPPGNKAGDLNGDGTVKISTIALDDAFGIGFQNAMETVVAGNSPSAIYEKTKHAKDANLDQYDWGAALELLTDTSTEGAATPSDVAPDVIIEFTFPQFSLALVRAYAGDTLFLHTHSMRERPVVLAAESKLNGQEGTSYLPSDGASGIKFDERFRTVARSNRDSQWDSHVYDGGFLFALAAVKASLDMEDPSEVSGEAIRDAMLTLNNPSGTKISIGPEEFAKGVEALAQGKTINYEGASGPCDFDPNGRAVNKISHWRVNDSTAEDVAVYNCVDDYTSCPKVP